MSSSRGQPPPETNDPPPPAGGGKPPPRRGWGPLRHLLAYTRGLIVDQHLRRQTMFYVVLAAMLTAFSGDVLFGDWLDYHHHLVRFLVYWLVCGWLTVLAALLAVYDLLLLRVQHRLLRRELRTRILGDEPGHEPPPDREKP